MHINRLLIDVQESSPMAFKIAKTPELPGALDPTRGPKAGPWTPPVMARTLPHARLVSLQQHQLLLDGHFFQNDRQLQNPSQGPGCYHGVPTQLLCWSTCVGTPREHTCVGTPREHWSYFKEAALLLHCRY